MKEKNKITIQQFLSLQWRQSFFSSLIPFLDLPLMMFKMVASERSCNCCKQSCFNSPLLISCLDRRKEWEEEEKEKSRRNVVGFNIEPLDGRERKVARTLLLSSVATDIYVGSFFIYIYSERRGDERMRELRNGPVGPTAAKSSAAYRSSSQTWDCQLRQDRARVFPFSSPPPSFYLFIPNGQLLLYSPK